MSSYRSLLAGGGIQETGLEKGVGFGHAVEEIFWVGGNSLSKVTKVRKYKVYGEILNTLVGYKVYS